MLSRMCRLANCTGLMYRFRRPIFRGLIGYGIIAAQGALERLKVTLNSFSSSPLNGVSTLPQIHICMREDAYCNAKVAVYNPPAVLALLPHVLMRHICGEDINCCVRKVCSLEVCLADCIFRRTHVNDVIADQVLRF